MFGAETWDFILKNVAQLHLSQPQAENHIFIKQLHQWFAALLPKKKLGMQRWLPTSPSRISALNHKIRDDSMKNGAVVISTTSQFSKVSACFWRMIPVKLDAYIAHTEKDTALSQSANLVLFYLLKLNLLTFLHYRASVKRNKCRKQKLQVCCQVSPRLQPNKRRFGRRWSFCWRHLRELMLLCYSNFEIRLKKLHTKRRKNEGCRVRAQTSMSNSG